MRLGIVSPVVAQPPGAHAQWEREAGIEEIGQVAERADRLGYHHLTCSEHVAVPAAEAAKRGHTYWDPLATFGYLAARTSRIRLATQVLVLGYHHPLALAKRYGTLDRISGGRLTLGLGVGSLREEFALLGVPFEGRGARADEAIAALRAALSERVPRFHGEFYDFADFVVEPHATQEQVPLWIGGRTPRSLRRALAHGDGWVPFGRSLRDLTDMLTRAHMPEGFEVVLSAGHGLDPAGSHGTTERTLHQLREAGATIASASLTATSATHYNEQLEALRSLGDNAGLTFGARDG